MKRLPPPLAVAAVAVLSLAAPLHAQRSTPAAIDRGSMAIDGSASLSRSRTTADGAGVDADDTSTQASLQPSLLYFVAPRFAVGGTLELSRFKGGAATTSAVGIGPAARLYFAGESATVLPYIGTSARVVRVALDIDGSASRPAETQWGLEGVAGITWLFSRQVGIVTEAFARRLSYSNSGFANDETVDVTNTELGLRFGVAAFIPKER